MVVSAGAAAAHSVTRWAVRHYQAAVHLVRSAVHVVARAATATVTFVKHHAAAIASIVVSTAVFIGCDAALGVATGGVGAVAGAVACGALAGAAGNAVGYGITAAQTGKFSLSGLAGSISSGALAGALGGFLGGAGAKVIGMAGRAVASGLLSDGAATTRQAATSTAADGLTTTATQDTTSTITPEEGADLYHGTSSTGARNIMENGVDPSYAPRPRDFGNGFYTTRDLGQAAQWAARKFGSEGVVLRFSVPADALNSLDSLSFEGDSPDLQAFLRSMRGGGSHDYDMVEGPMLLNPRDFMKGAAPVLGGNQATFFGDRAATLLNDSLVGIVP